MRFSTASSAKVPCFLTCIMSLSSKLSCVHAGRVRLRVGRSSCGGGGKAPPLPICKITITHIYFPLFLPRNHHHSMKWNKYNRCVESHTDYWTPSPIFFKRKMYKYPWVTALHPDIQIILIPKFLTRQDELSQCGELCFISGSLVKPFKSYHVSRTQLFFCWFCFCVWAWAAVAITWVEGEHSWACIFLTCFIFDIQSLDFPDCLQCRICVL